jgi:hypothetical protein
MSLEIAQVQAELEVQLEATRRRINRGIVVVALVPLVLAMALVTALALGDIGILVGAVFGIGYTLIGTIAGIAMIAGGAVEHRHISKQLREVDPANLLPAARVVIRD